MPTSAAPSTQALNPCLGFVCSKGMFVSDCDVAAGTVECLPCRLCDGPGQTVLQECSTHSDRVCSPVVLTTVAPTSMAVTTPRPAVLDCSSFRCAKGYFLQSWYVRTATASSIVYNFGRYFPPRKHTEPPRWSSMSCPGPLVGHPRLLLGGLINHLQSRSSTYV